MAPRSPLSEGEIASGDEEKAISTKQDCARTSKVNQDHRRSPSSSRALHPSDPRGRGRRHSHDRSRSRSPYRRAHSDRSSPSSRSSSRSEKGPQGSKRPHLEDHYSRGSSDPRRFKVHYEPEDVPPADHRSNRTNERHHRPRSPPLRSPSPFRHDRSKGNSRYAPHHRPERSQRNHKLNERGTGEDRNIHAKMGQVKLGQPGGGRGVSIASHEVNAPSSDIAGGGPSSVANGTINKNLENTNTEGQPQLTEAEIIALRRKRREAIRNKHKSDNGLLVQALEQTMASTPSTPVHESSGAPSLTQSPKSQAPSPAASTHATPPGSPAALVVESDMELVNPHQVDSVLNEDAGPAAADYDPSMDMQEDRVEHKRQDLHETKSDHPQPLGAPPQMPKEFDMFAEDDDDDDDMFAATDNTDKGATMKEAKTLDASLLDNWDYPDGHYRIILGELMDGRYAVREQVGKGTFATVIRAQDVRTGKSVAVKIACNNDTMFKAGQKEMDMLTLLNQEDPDDKKHIIRMERSFMHKGHLCLVFESLSADLREILKKFGRNSGLHIKAIRSYAQQIFLALSHLKKCQVLHADIKPDNILVSEKRNALKVCDLGTASFINDTEITPYLVSRFYRAPEVILGMELDYALDMWSVGCTLFELYTGRIAFTGNDNNQMLRAIQSCRGKFPMRMLKKANLAANHFDGEGSFHSQERDRLTGKLVARVMHFTKADTAGKDLKTRLSSNTKDMTQEELLEHMTFVDLMEKCLQLDPTKRVTPNDALRHPFVNPTKPKATSSGPAVVAPPRIK